MNTTDIESLVAPVAAAHALEVDRIEVLTAGKRSVVRIFLDGDGPVGRGPSLDEIATATRAISVAFDGVDITRGRPYTLEVSSRGVTRPLTEARHFRRNTGRLVVIDSAGGQLTGRVVAVDSEDVEPRGRRRGAEGPAGRDHPGRCPGGVEPDDRRPGRGGLTWTST